MSTVKNQGQCSSCCTFATCAIFEAKTRILKNDPGLVIDVSEQALLSCGSASCTSGSNLYNECGFFKSAGGCPDEACYPYTSGTTQTVPPCSNRCADWASRAYTMGTYGYDYRTLSTPRYTLAQWDDMLKTEIMNGPVCVAMDIYDDFYSYGSGIYSHVTGVFNGGKSMVLYGWDVIGGIPCWLGVNSWGTSWGEVGPDGKRGWFKIVMGSDNCNIEEWMYWLTPVVSAPAALRHAAAPGVPHELALSLSAGSGRSSAIRYTLPQAAFVSLSMYDMRGNRVAALVNRFQPAGDHAALFSSARLAPGPYLLLLRANGREQRQMTTILH